MQMDKIINKISKQAQEEFWESYLDDIKFDLMSINNIKENMPEYFKSIRTFKRLEKLSLAVIIAVKMCKLSKYQLIIENYRLSFAKLCSEVKNEI